MNKIYFRMLAVVMIFSTISCFSSPINKNNTDNPKTPPKDNSFIGTWQLCKSDSTLNSDLNGRVGTAEFKIITGETFTVILIENNKKFFMGEFSGTYTFKDDLYTETIVYANPSMANGLGLNNSFKYELKNGYFIIEGTNNSYNQIWKKIKD